MNKVTVFFVAVCLFSQTALAQSDIENPLREPLQESIQNYLHKEIEKEIETIRVHLDSVKDISGSPIEFTEEDVLIGQRIHRMQGTIPLEYNDRVKAYLDKYISRNYKPYMEKLLGLSQYYFPIYETVFEEMGIPDEIKYLSVVESSLNPHTLSTAGALGPWQFIYSTAKIYNLSMDGSYDERKDVFSSTYAVSQYLSEAYNEFNDWLLALASYNCGRGCVRRAIQRSGMTNPTYWELSPYLPRETRNYIPKYVAMTYALNHAELHGLAPQVTPLQSDYQIVMVDKHIDINNVARAVGQSIDILKEFNPAFKKNMVNGTVESPKRLIIPHQHQLNDSLLYLALNNQTVPIQHIDRAMATKGEVVNTRLASNLNKAKTATSTSTKPKYMVYTVRRGDTLSGIASKHRGATVKRLRADNNIKGSHLSIGQKIKVYQGQG